MRPVGLGGGELGEVDAVDAEEGQTFLGLSARAFWIL
jgi:hypothetical protein